MQIAERREHILLPVKVSFIALTLLVALLFNLAPWPDLRGVPDMLALVIAFWSIHQPRKMGIAIPWALGLVMDAGNGALIGQHAFAYAILAFGAQTLHRRILWFPLWPQTLHVLVLLLATQALMVAVRLLAGGTFPGWSFFAGSVIAAALWPAATHALLAPQRRPETVDENRPI
ncbi:MAG: rod shape-determining protein MreD [Burkholderiales bacterium]|nr:rod shape-determining protein MreD [Burkholderiales bacterium]